MEWIFKIVKSLVFSDLSRFCRHFITKPGMIISAIKGIGPAFNLYTSGLPISIGGSGHGVSLIGLLLTVSLFDWGYCSFLIVGLVLILVFGLGLV